MTGDHHCNVIEKIRSKKYQIYTLTPAQIRHVQPQCVRSGVWVLPVLFEEIAKTMLCFFSCLAWVSPVLFGDSAKTSSLDGCSWVWVSLVLFEDSAKSDPLFGRRCVPVAAVASGRGRGCMAVAVSLPLLWPVAVAVAVLVSAHIWLCVSVGRRCCGLWLWW